MVTVEEAMKAMDEVAIAFKDLAASVIEVWEQIKAMFEDNPISFEPAPSYPILWDSRKPSQVMNNKPRYMVRKIIR